MTIKGKDLIERISDKEYSEGLLKELEKYEVKRPKSVWELKNGDKIWITLYYDDKGYSSLKTQLADWEGDCYRREKGEIHLTKERAELHARVLNTELALKKWKRENDNIEPDWSDKDQYKCLLMYDYRNEKLRVSVSYAFKYANTIYFSSESATLQCVEDIGKERITEWLKWEDNDQ